MISKKSLKTLEYDKILNELATFAVSSSTKEKIFSLEPDTAFEKISHSLKLTAEADKILFEHLESPSLAFDDTRACLERTRKMSILTMGEILRVGRLLRASRVVKTTIDSINDAELTKIRFLTDELFISFKLEKDIFRAILSENEMADTASPELYSIRQKINRCNDRIREKLNSYITSSATTQYLQDNIITMRNDRYVIPVKSQNKGQVSGLIHDQSASGSTVYVEPMMVVELNNELKILVANEEKEILRILREFTTRISIDVDRLITNQTILVELDLVFAKAKYSKTFKGVMPDINSKGEIDIIEGRHPLINKNEVVPVSVKLGKDYKILMITGPNTGGKTVTLKLTGLLTLMAMTGLFIPAGETSKIAVFEDIWCDIGDEQSIEQSLSTFSSHITNLINITESVNNKALILFDELGAGTDPQEGAGLAIAITNHILAKGARGIITTHYPELKEFSFTTQNVENASMDFDPKTFKPTYNLVIGVPGASNAIQIAKRLGLNKKIIEEAQNMLSEDKINFENVLIKAEEARRKALDVHEDIKVKHNELSVKLNDVEREKKKIIRQREQIEAKAQKETKRLIAIAMQEVNEIVDEIKAMLKENDKIDIFRAHKLRKKLESIDIESEHENMEKDEVIDCLDGVPKVGEDVYIKTLSSKGVVDSINKKGEFIVKMGPLSTVVKQKDLVRIKDKKKKKNNNVNVTKPHSYGKVQSEINLIGQNSDEAIYNLDAFLSSTATSNLTEVRIVHGKGAGILRKAVHKYLKGCKLVTEYRLGAFGEGDRGVTIAKLK